MPSVTETYIAQYRKTNRKRDRYEFNEKTEAVGSGVYGYD